MKNNSVKIFRHELRFLTNFFFLWGPLSRLQRVKKLSKSLIITDRDPLDSDINMASHLSVHASSLPRKNQILAFGDSYKGKVQLT